ncbi:MAG: MATE family efflux transporter [Angelakisella sp.]|nr:MATE family efflux transporter [Angelakisella sp.]
MFTKKDLSRLIVPLIIEQLLAVTIGLADTLMVSSVGEAAVSGVSTVDTINILLINIFSALATGGSIVAAQHLGKDDTENAGMVAKQLIYAVAAISVVVMGICLLMGTPLLHGIFGNLEPSVMETCRVYFFWSALSYPFIAIYNAGAALFRSMGNSKVSMFTSLVMNIINVSGNAIFIFVFQWGVAGAAIASLISRCIGSIIVIVLLKNQENRIHIEDLLRFEWHPHTIKQILGLGIPNGLENGMFQIGKILVQGLVASFGTAAIAANAVANSVGTCSSIPGSAIGLALITVVGQCVGAGDYAAAKRYTFKLVGIAFALIMTINVCLYFSTPFLTGLYGLPPQTTQLAQQLLYSYFALCVFWPFAFPLPNGLRAAGDVKFTMAVSIFSMWVFRVGFSYLLGRYFGLGVLGVWIGMYIDWIFRGIAFVLRLAGSRWHNKAVV